jgi:hypothetical protein
MSRNFMVTVKDRQRDEPFFLAFETYDDVGLGKKVVMLDLQPGIDIEEAKELARRLNAQGSKFSVVKFGE